MKKKSFSMAAVFTLVMLISYTAMVIAGIKNIEYHVAFRPVFTGSEIDRGYGRYNSIIEISFYAQLIIGACMLVSLIISKGKSLPKKIFRIVGFIIIDIVLLAISVMISYSNVETDDYHWHYFVVSDRDKTVDLLFEEGAFLFDGRTNVYCLDNEKHVYSIGSFSTDDGMCMNGNYDIIRNGNNVTFEYDYGTSYPNGDKYYKTITLQLPDLSE